MDGGRRTDEREKEKQRGTVDGWGEKDGLEKEGKTEGYRGGDEVKYIHQLT